MKKVLTTTEFLLWLQLHTSYSSDFEQTSIRYAKLMQQPLELGMFVPCGEDGEPIEYYECDCLLDDMMSDCEKMCSESPFWYEAVDGVLFDGWKLREFYDDNSGCSLDHNETIHVLHLPDGQLSTGATGLGGKIEELIQLELKPTKAFLNKIGL